MSTYLRQLANQGVDCYFRIDLPKTSANIPLMQQQEST